MSASRPRSPGSTGTPTRSPVHRGSWPTCAPTSRGSAARRSPRRCASSGCAGSAPRSGARPRSSTTPMPTHPMRRNAAGTLGPSTPCGSTDISYLRTWQGWLYLATVIDAHSRRVIGWAIDEHMRTDLVEDVLQMAITLRGELPAQVVFHTDRGIHRLNLVSTPRRRSPRSRPRTASPGRWD